MSLRYYIRKGVACALLGLLVVSTSLLNAQEPSASVVEVGAGDSSLSGMVFEDENENGLRSAGEEGAGGIAVELLDEEGEFVARVITDEKGAYAFSGIAEGTYFLRFQFEPTYGVRSRGIAVGADGDVVFSPVPIISPSSNYSFIRLNLMNPANFKGEEVSPFKP